MFLRPNFHLKSTSKAVFVLLALPSCHPEADERVFCAAKRTGGCCGWLRCWGSGCVVTVLCSEADEEELLSVSLKGVGFSEGEGICCGGMDFALEAVCCGSGEKFCGV